jgi:hypothetical protein
MDIIVHSLLDKVRSLKASLHIRYYARPRSPEKACVSKGQDRESQLTGGRDGMTSYVIIHRQYSYLEPLIRSMFEDAQDVRVIIDRRSESAHDATTPETEEERRSADERRASSPMLDILINVES